MLNPAEAVQSQGWGRVNMIGSIIEAACAIDVFSQDQTINIGILPINQIAQDGLSTKRSFSIQLISCILAKDNQPLPDLRHVQITFDGQADAGAFGVEGEAKGIALQITDSRGNIVMPGVPLPVGNITAKDMLLNYSIRLVKNHQLLHSGEYSSTVKFKMDYY